MASEKYNNLASSLLDGDIDNAVTSLDVVSAASFPATGDFRIVIGAEIIKVTAVSSNTFTVARGQEGSSAAAHTDGDAVTHVVTAASLDRICHQNVSTADVIGSRPSAGDAGRLFFPTDGQTVQRDTGSVWTPYGPIHRLKGGFVLADFTPVNDTGGSTAVASDQDGIIVVQKPPQAGINVTLYLKAAPATPYTVEALMRCAFSRSSSQPSFGLCFRASGAPTTPEVFGITHSNVTQIAVNRHSSFTAQGAQLLSEQNLLCQQDWWLRISDNGTNRKFWISIDGKNWALVTSTGSATFITANEIGFYVDHQSGASSQFDMLFNLLSWRETADNV